MKSLPKAPDKVMMYKVYFVVLFITNPAYYRFENLFKPKKYFDLPLALLIYPQHPDLLLTTASISSPESVGRLSLCVTALK